MSRNQASAFDMADVVERFRRLSPAKRRIFLDHLDRLYGEQDKPKLSAVIDDLEAALARESAKERVPRTH